MVKLEKELYNLKKRIEKGNSTGVFKKKNPQFDYKKYLEDNPNSTARDIASFFGISFRAVRAYCKQHNLPLKAGKRGRPKKQENE